MIVMVLGVLWSIILKSLDNSYLTIWVGAFVLFRTGFGAMKDLMCVK